MGMRIPGSILVHELLGIEIQIQFMKPTTALNLNFLWQVNYGPESNMEFSIEYEFQGQANHMDKNPKWSSRSHISPLLLYSLFLDLKVTDFYQTKFSHLN